MAHRKVEMDDVISEVDYLIKKNRKICWESEFENGEYCIGEEKVKELIKLLIDRFSILVS